VPRFRKLANAPAAAVQTYLAGADQAQKPLADMKQHMSMCRNMMNMMEKMHGMSSPK